MPRTVGVIQKPGLFEDLLSRMGVNRPTVPFTLDGEVVPVIIVDSGISFVAAPTPAYNVTDVFTAGVVIAPAVNTVLADTGPLPVGAYSVQVMFYAEENPTLELQWRDVPNAANLFTQEIRILTNTFFQFSTRWNVENAGERFRMLNTVVGGVGIKYQCTIMAKI